MTAPPGPAAGAVVHAEPVMGTVVSFRVLPGGDHGGAGTDRLEAGLAEACRILHRADAVFSRWQPASPLSRLRRGECLRAVPPEIPEVLALCAEARELSEGWFDPWAMPGGVDPTGLVKGWAVERALAPLRDAGATAALVNGGGDLAAFGRPSPGAAWRVGIRHPWRPDALACVITVDTAVATSGCYERGPHLIDPRTGRPGARAASATVTGPSLALADALATALAVAGEPLLKRLAALDGYEAYLIGPNGRERWTPGMAFADAAADDDGDGDGEDSEGG